MSYRLAIVGESQAQLNNGSLREWLNRAGFKVSSGWGPKVPEEDTWFGLIGDQLPENTPVLSLGEATTALTGYKLPTHKVRGSLLPMKNGGWLVATLSPADVGPAKGQDHLKPHLGGDARRSIECPTPKIPRVIWGDKPIQYPPADVIVSVDIEGANGRPNIVGVSWSEEEAFVFPWSNEMRLWLTELFRTNVPTFHNASFDVAELEEAGVTPPKVWWDTIVMAALYDPSAAMNLQTQVLTHVPGSVAWKGLVNHENRPDFVGKGVRNWRELWTDTLQRLEKPIPSTGSEWYQFYNGLDTTWGLALANQLKRKLTAQGRWNYYTDVLMPLQQPLLQMGNEGMPLDLAKLGEHQENCQRWKDEARTIVMEVGQAVADGRPPVYSKAKTPKLKPPVPFNPDSPKQLGEILYDHYGLPVIRTPKRGRCVNEDAIKDLTSRVTRGTAKVKGDKDECLKVLEAVTAYNHWGHWLDTFLNPPIGHRGDGSYLLTAYSLHRTTTGRLSSGLDTSDLDKSSKKVRKAQVQNIPKKLRDMVAAPEGYLCVGGDWTAFQLALFLWFAERVERSGFHAALLDKIRAGEIDPHSYLASIAEGVPETDISKTDPRRQNCKQYTFGGLFGGSFRTLARKAGHPDAVGTKLEAAHEKAFRKYQWWETLMAEVKKKKFVQTPLGWRRYFWEWQPKREEVTATLIQATEADVFKWVKLRADRDKPKEWHWLTDTHDFTSMYVPEKQALEAQAWLKGHMESPIPFLDNSSWRAQVVTGDTWEEISA